MIKSHIFLLTVIVIVSFCGCCANTNYETSEMKFSTDSSSDPDALYITSCSPRVPIAGDEDKIVYIDQDGNIICYDCAAKMEKMLVKATPSDKKAGTYSSIVLDGNKVYYRVFGLDQWDMLYCVDIDSCCIQTIGKIYMDSSFYVQDGKIYNSENLNDLLKTTDDSSVEYSFNVHDTIIVCDGKVYLQASSQASKDIIVFDLESGVRNRIPFSDRVRLFCSDQNHVYYESDTEFGEIKDGVMQKIIDLQEFDVYANGSVNVQMIGKYIVIGNDWTIYIYNKDTNSLETIFSDSAKGPFLINGELVFRSDEELSYYYTRIGQGYYSLDIENAIEEKNF